MPTSFGPWSTAISPGDCPQLSAFWRRRMAMLSDPNVSISHLSRREVLRLGACGVLAGLTPTLPGVAQSEEESRKAPEARRPDHIYLNVSFEATDPTDPATGYRGFIRVDPDSGEYEKLRIESGHSIRLSPDGETLAYVDDGVVWTNNREGTSPGKIIEAGGEPVWTPDGKFLIVSHGTVDKEEDQKEEPEKPVWNVKTWKCDLLGNIRLPVPIPETDFVDDITPDGEWFVTSSDRHAPYGRGYQLYVMRPDGSEQRRLSEGPGLNVYARVSPDGRWVLYTHQRRGDESLQIVSLDGRERRRITTDPDIGPHACWSPDGKRIAAVIHSWERTPNGGGRLTPETADWRLVVMDAEGGNERRLPLPKATFLGAPDWR